MSGTTGGFFSDPTMMSLLGAAGALGSAAMPSRLPVPIGAALGLAAGGLASGANQAQKYAKENIELQAAKSALPMTLARNQMLTSVWQHPELMQQLMGGGASGTPATPVAMPSLPATPTGAPLPAAASGGGASSPSLVTSALGSLPDDATRKIAINAAISSGLPVEAWPAWISGVHNESGWNLNAPTGKAGEIGPGQVMPATGQQLGYTPQQLADPATNLQASAKYFNQQWAAANNDPAKAFAGYNAGNVNASVPDYTGRAMTRLAQWGYPGGPAAAGASGGSEVTPQNALMMAQQYEAQANQLERQIGTAKYWQSQGMPVMPPVGDPAALRQAAQQYRDLALAGPKAGAQARAEITEKPVFDRYGNAYKGDGKGGFIYLGRGSEVKPVWNAERNQMEYGDVGGLGIGVPGGVGGAGHSAGAGGTGGTGIGQAAAPPPMQEHFMTERGKDLAEQFHKVDLDAASAKEGNYLFDNLRNDSQSWEMGKFANWEGDARAYLSAFAHQLGIPSEGMDKKLADYQAFLKSSGSLLRTAVHDTSSRAAVQEYNLIGQTLPQPTTSQQGFAQVADQWQGANDFRLAKQKFAQQYQGHPQDFNVDFNSKVSMTSFMLNRMAQSPQGQVDMKDMLTRMQATPEGRMTARHMLTEYQYAKQHGLFDDLSPTGNAVEAPPGGQ